MSDARFTSANGAPVVDSALVCPSQISRMRLGPSFIALAEASLSTPPLLENDYLAGAIHPYMASLKWSPCRLWTALSGDPKWSIWRFSEQSTTYADSVRWSPQ